MHPISLRNNNKLDFDSHFFSHVNSRGSVFRKYFLVQNILSAFWWDKKRESKFWCLFHFNKIFSQWICKASRKRSVALVFPYFLPSVYMSTGMLHKSQYSNPNSLVSMPENSVTICGNKGLYCCAVGSGVDMNWLHLTLN